jgi:hypothetical protein
MKHVGWQSEWVLRKADVLDVLDVLQKGTIQTIDDCKESCLALALFSRTAVL